MKRIACSLVALALIALLLSGNQQTKSQAYGDEWWNGSWHYRVKLTVNTTYYERTDWPLEHDVNFTVLINDLNITGDFDQNSTRIVEVNDSGGLLHEIPSQFDPADDFNISDNAMGTIVFTLNGTTGSYSERWFYLYFDTTDNKKKDPSYSAIIQGSWNGEEFNVTFNNEDTQYYGFFVFDTNRSENTSGLYQYRLCDEWRFTYSGSGERTREYVQTTDGSQDYGYDLRGNASVTSGSERVTVSQEGYETYWGEADNRTNMTYLKKTYKFYPNKTWFVVEHEIVNINNSAVTRGSYAGVSGFDLLGAYGAGYKMSIDSSQDPGSYGSGSASLGTERGGYGHLWENGTTNFIVANYTSGGSPNYDRIGINLSMTSIQPGESIQDRSVMVFYHTVNSPMLLTETMNGFINNVNVTQEDAEMWVVSIEPESDHDIYNRNESAIIGVNVTRDEWGISDHVNATLDMGTPGAPGDDVTIQLLDDGNYPDQSEGDGYFTSYYNFTESEATGYWNVTAMVYDADGSVLNESYYTFNITSELIVDIAIWNYTGIYRLENATVNLTNFRQDMYIPGATLNCTSAGNPIPQGNITDNGYGSYLVVFETPVDYGLYPLNCSAGKDGSWGFSVKNYTVEAPETNISVATEPTSFDAYNVTFYGNETFNLRVTLQNMENSTAYDANISLNLSQELSSNSTFEECGDVMISLTCIRDFNITVLNNTGAGDYDIDVFINWTNRIFTTGSNITNITVTVHENPVLDMEQDNVTGILPPGASSQPIATVDVISAGNNDTLNITLAATGLDNFTIEFFPNTTDVLAPGNIQPVQVEASVPSGQFPGIYYGWINVTSENGGYKILNTTIIVTGTNLTINATPDNYSALYVTAFSNESFCFTVEVNNTGNTTAFNSYINVSLPPSWFINSTIHQCGNISRDSKCVAYFFVNITEMTYSGNYSINTTVYWEDIGISWQNRNDTINVTVVQNITLEVAEDEFLRTMEHGTSIVIGNMTVRSTGNDNVTGIRFNLGQEFDNFTIGFNQTYPFDMVPGDLRTIRINATIPPGFDPGFYDGTLNVSSDNNGQKLVNINITVPQNGSWVINTTFCEHAQSPETGVVCDVLINNTGNLQMNFSIYPPGGANHTTPSNATLNITKQDSAILSILYDMEGEAGQGFFLTNYTINTTEALAVPNNVTLEIILNPYVSPLTEIGITPTMQLQGGSLGIVINVTSQSGADFDDIIATVERPDGTNDTLPLGFGQQVFWYGCDFIIDDPWDKLCYSVNYPGSFGGNSSLRGNYTIYVYANDTFGVNGTNTSIFEIYVRYMADLEMPNTTQGNWESINYRARDYMGAPLPSAAVNLSVKDPENRTVYMLSGSEYTTDESGWVSDNIFVIPAHATTGEYTIYSNGTYYDPDAELWVGNETTSKFYVIEEENLMAKVAVPSPSYVDNMMTVSVIILDEYYTPIDPDTVNLTIYYTEGYTLQSWRQLDLADFDRESTGFYKYSEVLSSVLTGSYLALLRVTHEGREVYDIEPFRISSGGPYDVFLDLSQNEISAGNPLNFDITIWNKGEIDHVDVITDYWVYGNGQIWDSSSFSSNILGGENKTFSRSAFIYSNQPPGLYTLNAEVLFDPNQPPATSNATFLVKGKEAPPEEEGGGGGGEGAEGGAVGGGGGNINITKAPDQVGAMVGLPVVFNVRVKAEGGPVRNVWLDFQGIPSEWIVMEPENITYLAGGDSAIFTVQVTVPRGESGERMATIVAHSTEGTDEKEFILRIFTSRKDLINFELNRLGAKLTELRDKSKSARETGFDTNEVDDLLDDAEGQIRLAEGYLKEELYDAALESVYSAWSLLDEAENLLDRMFTGFVVPWWIFIIIIFAAIIVGMFFLYRKISKNLSILIRGRMSEARQVAGTIKAAGAGVEKLREEKGKTERMLGLLNSQYRQGIISKEAYESLRKRSQERINELDKKIRETIKGS